MLEVVLIIVIKYIIFIQILRQKMNKCPFQHEIKHSSVNEILGRQNDSHLKLSLWLSVQGI
jgi:hypothetical protein